MSSQTTGPIRDSHWSGLIAIGVVFLSSIFAIDITTVSAQVPTVPKGVNGYTISIDQEWSRSGYSGFRPVRVTIDTNPAKATVDDEWFEIESRCREYRGGERVMSSKLVIAAGQKSGSAEIYIHDLFSMNSYDNQILVKKDGRVLRREQGLSANNWEEKPRTLAISDRFPARPTSQSVWHSGSSQVVPRLLGGYTSKSPLPSFGYLGSIYDVVGQPALTGQPAKTNFPVATTAESWTALSSKPEMFHYTRFSDLPQSWIGLQGVDQIVISLAELGTLTRSSPLQRSNLEKWIITGGTLIVHSTGPKFKKAQQIWPSLLGPDRDFVAEQKMPVWSVPNSKVKELFGLLDPSGKEADIYGYHSGIWMSAEVVVDIDIDASKWKQYPDPTKIPKTAPFGICNYLNGRIVAVNSDMSKWKPDDWKLLHNTIAAAGISINHRVAATSLEGEGRGFNFQIPGVGQPPVKTFQVLIGLFLLLAGPIMMIVLKRLKQMQYLFIAVPLLSAIVCGSLVVYAIAVDGSNQWGRSQTVTHLDHRTSMAVTHSRATYYSGKHPGAYGLPVDGLGIATAEDNSRLRVDFENNSMKLSGGNIAARIPHEVMVARPYETNHRLLVLPGKETDTAEEETDSKKAAPPRVQNRLEADVRWALIRTDKGYFVVNNLKAGQTTASQATKLSREAATVRRIVNELSPVTVGLNVNSYNAYYSNEGTEFGEDHRVVCSLRDGDIGDLLDRPNSYFALMEEFPLVAEQLEPVEYKMQLHVVRGQW